MIWDVAVCEPTNLVNSTALDDILLLEWHAGQRRDLPAFVDFPDMRRMVIANNPMERMPAVEALSFNMGRELNGKGPIELQGLIARWTREARRAHDLGRHPFVAAYARGIHRAHEHIANQLSR